MPRPKRLSRFLRAACTASLAGVVLFWFLTGFYAISVSRALPSHEPQRGPYYTEQYDIHGWMTFWGGQWVVYGGRQDEQEEGAAWHEVKVERRRVGWQFSFVFEEGFVGPRVMVLPLWVPAALLAAPAAWLWWPSIRDPRRKRAGSCPGCGYDRGGLARASRCPECGRASLRRPSVESVDRGKPAARQ